MTSQQKYSLGFSKSFGALMGLAVLAVILTNGSAPVAYASHTGIPPSIQVDLINGEAPENFSCPDRPLSSPVTIIGSGQGSTPPGKVEQYGVLVDWGDGSPIEIATATFTPPTGNHKDFTFTFETAPHAYVDGAYTISISLFHSEPSGNDNQIDSTVILDVCTFTPVAPAIQVDLVNGQDPSNFSCPDNPPSNPVTIAGSGQGSAPPPAGGDVSDYFVRVNWGDGSPEELAPAVFDPATGILVNFTYTFATPAHEYTDGGTFTVTLSLEYSDPSGGGDQVAASTTIDVCIQIPTGTVTGEVTDAETGLPIFGAVVEDRTDLLSASAAAKAEQDVILGSFPGGSIYVIEPPLGIRTICVSAEGWQTACADVPVTTDQVAVVDFALDRIETTLGIVEVTLPIGNIDSNVFLLPQCVEAVQNGEVVATSCVHAGPIYFFIGTIPKGQTTFRAANVFYDIDTETKNVSGSTDPGDDAPHRGNIQIDLLTHVPDESAFLRAAVITGGVQGVTSDGGSPVATGVYATFDFEGVPTTVTTTSDASTGIYVLDLIPPGDTTVYAEANAGTKRSPDELTTIVGGEFVTENLTVLPFDPSTQNFVPVVTDPTQVADDEDVPLLLAIDDFVVTDGDDSFSVDHTLQAYPGFNYSLSNNTGDSVQLTPDPDWFGSLTVPVTVSDGTSTSSPLNLTVNVNAVPDATVYVDFDAAGEAFGSASKPFQTVGDALGHVAPGGTILITGGKSTESPLTINQPVTLDNSDATDVIIDPNLKARSVETTAVSGFVTRSSNPE